MFELMTSLESMKWTFGNDQPIKSEERNRIKISTDRITRYLMLCLRVIKNQDFFHPNKFKNYFVIKQNKTTKGKMMLLNALNLSSVQIFKRSLKRFQKYYYSNTSHQNNEANLSVALLLKIQKVIFAIEKNNSFNSKILRCSKKLSNHRTKIKSILFQE